MFLGTSYTPISPKHVIVYPTHIHCLLFHFPDLYSVTLPELPNTAIFPMFHNTLPSSTNRRRRVRTLMEKKGNRKQTSIISRHRWPDRREQSQAGWLWSLRDRDLRAICLMAVTTSSSMHVPPVHRFLDFSRFSFLSPPLSYYFGFVFVCTQFLVSTQFQINRNRKSYFQCTLLWHFYALLCKRTNMTIKEMLTSRKDWEL